MQYYIDQLLIFRILYGLAYNILFDIYVLII